MEFKRLFKALFCAGALYTTYHVGWFAGIYDTVQFMNCAEGKEISDAKQAAKNLEKQLDDILNAAENKE